jgi:L-ascorbate metabolism protein UlaG (beta-lactamase superfamily)
VWALHPDVLALLQRGERAVRLTAAQMTALHECLRGDVPVSSLAPELFAALFESGLVTPKALEAAPDARDWAARLPDLALSPFLRLSVQFRSGRIRLRGMDPSVGLFLDPDVVRVASALSARLDSAIRRVARDCAVRGIAFPRARADALLQEIAFRRLDNDPRARAWLEWSRDERGLHLSVPRPEAIDRKDPAFAECSITAKLGRRSRQATVPTAALPGLAAVFDVLRGGPVGPAAERALRGPGAAAVLGLIESIGGFIAASEAPPSLAQAASAETAMTATHLGHAHVLIDSEKHRILVDPYLHPGDAAFERQPPTARQLGRIDALFFTHHHDDHLNADSLLTLPHDVPVYVPAEATGPWRARPGDFLRAMGFVDVRPLRPRERVAFDDGLAVEAVPFYGESSATLGWNGLCYLASRGGRNLLLHADSSPDVQGRSIVSSGELRRIVERTGPIEAVFGSWWQEHTFAVQLGADAVLALPPSRWLEDAETCDCPTGYLLDLVRLCGAREFLYYAESGEELFLAERKRSDYLRTVSFLWTPREEITRLLSEAGVHAAAAAPYQRLEIPRTGPPKLIP